MVPFSPSYSIAFPIRTATLPKSMASVRTAYDSLLLKYKPRPIRNDREHRRVLKHVDELIGRHGPTPPRAEGELIAV